MEFKGKLGQYKIIETEDKTKTVWSEFFDENCHNISGAHDETLHNYIHGCNIPEQINSQQILHVLDVGFGVGIGLRTLIDYLKENEIHSTSLLYTSIELDEDLFLWAISENLKEYTFVKTNNYYEAILLIHQKELKAKIFIGDGRVTLREAHLKGEIIPFSAIFQDAFSPKKNPILWSVEWFRDLHAMSREDVYMSTYSSAIGIRKSMLEARWEVFNSPGFGKKRTMTIARLTGKTDQKLYDRIYDSPILPIWDKDICTTMPNE